MSENPNPIFEREGIECRCTRCQKSFRLTADFDGPGQSYLKISSCQSGGIYAIEVVCPFCQFGDGVVPTGSTRRLLRRLDEAQAMTEDQQAFLRAIIAAPDDDLPRLIYADYCKFVVVGVYYKT